MLNPFVSADKRFERAGYHKYYEGKSGFIFVKPIGDRAAIKIEFKDGFVRIYDPVLPTLPSMPVSADILRIISKKIDNWREQYEHNK